MNHVENYPSHISSAEWNRLDREPDIEDEEEFDPSEDMGGFCRSDEL